MRQIKVLLIEEVNGKITRKAQSIYDYSSFRDNIGNVDFTSSLIYDLVSRLEIPVDLIQKGYTILDLSDLEDRTLYRKVIPKDSDTVSEERETEKEKIMAEWDRIVKESLI